MIRWEEEGRERWNSLIQGMVAQMDKQHGPIWTSEDCTDQGYPPPNLQALLKLVLVPRINNMSVQAIVSEHGESIMCPQRYDCVNMTVM